MVKISRNSMITNRIRKLRAEVNTDTQKLRENALANLQQLFDMSKNLAQNRNVRLKQRQIWTRVAAYIAQVINSIATGFDTRQIDQDLEKLETLINEATTKNKAEETGTTNA